MLTSLSLKKINIPISSLAAKTAKYIAISILTIVVINIITAGCDVHSLGKIGHLLITAFSLALFLIYNKDKQNIITFIALWAFIFIPTFIVLSIGEPDGRTAKEIAITTAESNLFSINISVTLIAILSLSSCLSRNTTRNFARLFTCLLWSVALSLPASFYFYWLFANSLITSNTIIALFQTTPAEAIEYASFRGAKFSAGIIAFSLFFVIINIQLFSLKKKEVPLKKSCSINHHRNIQRILFI